MNITEMRGIYDKSFDSYRAALLALRISRKEKVVRTKPCSDCAVTSGLYTDIAAACHKFLGDEQKEVAKDCWSCHHGGRCEGAALVIGGPSPEE